MKKLIDYIKGFRRELYELKMLTAEVEYANRFHDAIKSIKNWQNQSLFVGNWAGNYTFFYVLARLLQENKFGEIVEFGLGESTKFISAYLDEMKSDTKHFVVEHDPQWLEHFQKKSSHNYHFQPIITPLVDKIYKQHTFTGYQELSAVSRKADLYIVDGPFGSEKASRCDIIDIIDSKVVGDEFIVIIDDVHREGEEFTFNEVYKLLVSKGLQVDCTVYAGKKSVGIIATNKFKFSLSF